MAYQVVDDSGGDSGLDGFNRVTRELHAFYCPEKPAAARFREKFRSDLTKAVSLRDEKRYPVKTFVFITPEPLREPDQRTLRHLAHENGLNDGINISAEYLEVLLARNIEILPQFPALSYPQLEQKVDRLLSIVEQMQRSGVQISAAHPASRIGGTAAQILARAVKAANKVIEGKAEAADIIQVLDLTNKQYKDAVDELNALGLVDIWRSGNAPGGYQRVGIRPDAFVKVAAQVLPGVDVIGEMEKLLQAFGSGGGEHVLATDILKLSSVPLPRAQLLIDYLKDHNLVDTSGMAGISDSLLFPYGRILPLGKRVLEGNDPLPL